MLTPSDLAALHAACFTTPRPWSEAELAGLLSLPDVFLVCERGPSFALGRVVAYEAELLTLAVHPDAQGRGLGRTTLKSFETHALQRGAQVSFLEVSVMNEAAIALYESHGYSESGKRPRYYSAPDGQKIDALLLKKALNSA